MANEDRQPTTGLERFRSYLIVLARRSLGAQAARLDASDVVQDALLEAYRKRRQFRGKTDAELAGWLRKVLAYGIADALRRLGRAKRGDGRVRSLQAALEQSSQCLEALLPADQSSPSQAAVKHEQLLRLSESLAELPEDQRRAVEMKYLDGLSVAEIAEFMGRSETAVGGLLRRGMLGLRTALNCQSRDG